MAARSRTTSSFPKSAYHDCESSTRPRLPHIKLTCSKILTLILFAIFAISLTLLLIYILNPDKEPLPWRAYCSVPSLATPFDHPAPPNSPQIYPNYTNAQVVPPFPHAELDRLPPAGVFIGVFSIDSAFERRMLMRSTWASHPRSRDGAGAGDDGISTSRTIVRFILGQPRKDWERRVKLEMESKLCFFSTFWAHLIFFF